MKVSFKKIIATLSLLSLILLLPRNVLAAPGDLDTSFGDNGLFVGEFGGQSEGLRSISLDEQNRVIMAGSSVDLNTNIRSFATQRVNIDGSLDTAFGDMGKVITDFDSAYAEIFDSLIQPDGKIIVAGSSITGQGSGAFSLARYNSDGGLDISFGDGGKVTTEIGSEASSRSILLQPDGKVIVIGQVFDSGQGFGLARYNSDGSLDVSFGNNGIVFTNGTGYAFASALLPDGRILVTGGYMSGYDFSIARYNTDGNLDQSFGQGGKLKTDFAGGQMYSTDVVLTSNGKFVAGGLFYENTKQVFGLVGFNENGSFDNDFGTNGIQTVNFLEGSRDQLTSLVKLPDGKLLVAGQSGDSSSSAFAISRLNQNGSLDYSFGLNGKITSQFNGWISGSIRDIVLLDDGGFFAGGVVLNPPSGNSIRFALAKYSGDNLPSASNAGSDQTVNEGHAVIFDGSGSTDPDGFGDIVSFEWDFGDGVTASGQTVNHTYIQDGIYNATLTVTDSAGVLSEPDYATVTVNNLAPVITQLSPIAPTLPAQINIGTSFTDAGILDTHTATIDWGDTTVTSGTINELFGSGTVYGSHTYTTAGLYTITLTVTDGTNSSFVSTAVQILTPTEAINELVDLVETFNLQQGINNSLDAKLNNALSALADMNENNDQAAINSLQSFINAVEAQRGIQITNEQADALIAGAQEIINYLSF